MTTDRFWLVERDDLAKYGHSDGESREDFQRTLSQMAGYLFRGDFVVIKGEIVEVNFPPEIRLSSDD